VPELNALLATQRRGVTARRFWVGRFNRFQHIPGIAHRAAGEGKNDKLKLLPFF
jgi:hypothetical protein